jgi:hypothetical protein
MDVGEHGNRRGQGICRPHLTRGCLLLRWSDRQQRDDNSQPEGHPQQKPHYTASLARGYHNPPAKNARWKLISQMIWRRRVKAPPTIRLGKIYRFAFDLKHIVNLELTALLNTIARVLCGGVNPFLTIA